MSSVAGGDDPRAEQRAEEGRAAGDHAQADKTSPARQGSGQLAATDELRESVLRAVRTAVSTTVRGGMPHRALPDLDMDFSVRPGQRPATPVAPIPPADEAVASNVAALAVRPLAFPAGVSDCAPSTLRDLEQRLEGAHSRQGVAPTRSGGIETNPPHLDCEPAAAGSGKHEPQSHLVIADEPEPVRPRAAQFIPISRRARRLQGVANEARGTTAHGARPWLMATSAAGALVLGLVVAAQQLGPWPEPTDELLSAASGSLPPDRNSTGTGLVVASLDRAPIASVAHAPAELRLEAAVPGAIAFSGAVGPTAGAEASKVDADISVPVEFGSLAKVATVGTLAVEPGDPGSGGAPLERETGASEAVPSRMPSSVQATRTLASLPREPSIAGIELAPRPPGRAASGVRPLIVAARAAEFPSLETEVLAAERQSHRAPTVRLTATDADVELSTTPTESSRASDRDPRLAMELAAEHLEKGDVGTARALLGPLATPDHPDAILALAETYDPIILGRNAGAEAQASAGRALALYSSVADLVGSAYPPLRARLEAANPLVAQAVLPVALGEANAMVARGDILSARELLAATARVIASAEVALAMARTYDPSLLARVPGGTALADVAEAESWYRKWQGLAIDEGSLSESANVDAIIRAMRRHRAPASAGAITSDTR
ncbi:MAG: hypothetical protein GC150_12335 [Rhizobiales bacterium]|nr:hypothetical protein [Hyphomicrobiales bacterium]